MTYPSNFYDITVHYEGNIPAYIGRVVACDEEQAKRLGFYDATNKGWPHNYASIEAVKLMN